MLSLRIALRYLLSRKSHGAVNIISAVSLASIAVAAAAMVIVLSVFNGFTQLAQSKLSNIDPDLKVIPAQGKVIADVAAIVQRITAIDGVALASPQISEQAFAIGNSKQMPITIMGMEEAAVERSGITNTILDGERMLSNPNQVLISVGVALGMDLRPTPGLDSLEIFEPRRISKINAANPLAAFRSTEMQVTGVFQIEQDDYDRDVVIMPFTAAAELVGYDNCASAICIYLASGADVRAVTIAVEECFHEAASGTEVAAVKVLDRYRQEEQAFRLIAIEKWITFLMLGFILVIASLNIISTLSMLMIEKHGNMHILQAMGATGRMINRVFMSQGWLIVILGGIAGIVTGALLVAGQQHFGWIKIGGSDPAMMSISVYPVVLRVADILVTLLAVTAVALLVSLSVPLIRRDSTIKIEEK